MPTMLDHDTKSRLAEGPSTRDWSAISDSANKDRQRTPPDALCLTLAILGAIAARWAVPFSLEYSIGPVPFAIGAALFLLYRARLPIIADQFTKRGRFSLDLELVVTALTALLLSSFLVLGSWATAMAPDALEPVRVASIIPNAFPLFVLLLWLWQALDRASSRFAINQRALECRPSAGAVVDDEADDANDRPRSSSRLRMRASSFLFGRWWPGLCFGILLLCWLPVFLAAYPGFFCYDMTIGDYPEWTQFSEHELYTHHPVFHTLLMGSIVRAFADLSGSFNFGVAAYVVIQAVGVAGIFAFMLVRVRHASGSHLLCGVSLAYLALDPLVSMFVFCTTKDTLFSAFAVMLAVLLYGYFADKEHRSIENLIALVLAGTAFCVLRPNGLFVFAALIPIVVAFALRGMRVRLLVSCVVALSLSLAWLGPISTMLEAKTTDLQRVNALSIPAQQLSYLYQNNLLEEGEKARLDSLGYEDEGSYLPYLADGSRFNILSIPSEDLLGAYLSIGVHHPMEYLTVFLQHTQMAWNPYSYIDIYHGRAYAGRETSLFGFDWESPASSQSLFPPLLDALRSISGNLALQNMPGLALLASIPAYLWLLVVLCARTAITRDRRAVPVCALFGLLVLSVLIGPCVLTRYYLYLLFGLPLMMLALVAARPSSRCQVGLAEGDQGGQVAWGEGDVAADATSGERDAVEQLGRLVDDRAELLAHADGRAAAVDVAGQGQQLAAGNHGDGLLPHRRGGLLQVQLLGHGHHEHVVLP